MYKFDYQSQRDWHETVLFKDKSFTVYKKTLNKWIMKMEVQDFDNSQHHRIKKYILPILFINQLFLFPIHKYIQWQNENSWILKQNRLFTL